MIQTPANRPTASASAHFTDRVLGRPPASADPSSRPAPDPAQPSMTAAVSSIGDSYAQAKMSSASRVTGKPSARAGMAGRPSGKRTAQATSSGKTSKSGKPAPYNPDATRVTYVHVGNKKATMIDTAGGDDTVYVSQLKNGKIRVDVNGGKANGGETIVVDPKLTPEIVINGGRGSDTIVVNDDVKQGLILDGGRGWDTDYLTGGGGKDVIYGGEGDDVIRGGFSKNRQDGDVIYTGPGNDEINGREGRDVKDFDVTKDTVQW